MRMLLSTPRHLRLLGVAALMIAAAACAAPAPGAVPAGTPFTPAGDQHPTLIASPDLPPATGGSLPVDFARAEAAYDALVSAAQQPLSELGITAVISPALTSFAPDGSVALAGAVLSSRNPGEAGSTVFILPSPDGSVVPVLSPRPSLLAEGTVLSPVQDADGAWFLAMMDPSQAEPFSEVFGTVKPGGRYGQLEIFPAISADQQGNNIRTRPDLASPLADYRGEGLKLQKDQRTPFAPGTPLVAEDNLIWAQVPLQDGSSGWMAVYDAVNKAYLGSEPNLQLQALVQKIISRLPEKTPTPTLSPTPEKTATPVLSWQSIESGGDKLPNFDRMFVDTDGDHTSLSARLFDLTPSGQSQISVNLLIADRETMPALDGVIQRRQAKVSSFLKTARTKNVTEALLVAANDGNLHAIVQRETDERGRFYEYWHNGNPKTPQPKMSGVHGIRWDDTAGSGGQAVGVMTEQGYNIATVRYNGSKWELIPVPKEIDPEMVALEHDMSPAVWDSLNFSQRQEVLERWWQNRLQENTIRGFTPEGLERLHRAILTFAYFDGSYPIENIRFSSGDAVPIQSPVTLVDWIRAYGRFMNASDGAIYCSTSMLSVFLPNNIKDTNYHNIAGNVPLHVSDRIIALAIAKEIYTNGIYRVLHPSAVMINKFPSNNLETDSLGMIGGIAAGRMLSGDPLAQQAMNSWIFYLQGFLDRIK